MERQPHFQSESEDTLERRLSPWQLAMIAMGSAIGVGLFLGSGATIGLAGPAVLISYLIAALVALILGYALAEMATVHPLAGSFGIYADRYLNRWAGYLLRTTYWFAQALAIGAQVTAVGLYCGYWFPAVPSWIFMASASALVIGVNAVHISFLGSLESVFSILKIAAILAFVAVGAALIAGWGAASLGFRNLTADGGFAPHGWRGVWLSLTLVITSYIGVEVIAVGAGEAKRPEVSVPRAMLGLVGGLIFLYLLSVFIVVTVIPWTVLAETGGSLSGSPFVKVFSLIGIPFAAGIMNLVVIMSALSGAATNLYLCTRMLFSLSRAGYVPTVLGNVNRRGVPFPALAASALGMGLAVFLASKGREVFLPLFGTAVAAMLSIWIIILLTHLRFRRRLNADGLTGLPLKVPFHPFPTLTAILILLAVLAATPLVAGLEWTVPLFLVWVAMASLFFRWSLSS
ncbi:MAG: amino acid permease [Acidobacteriota bacterium]